METDGSGPQRRIHQRNRVLVQVRWHNRREEGVSAELCDVSAEGVFLVPTGSLPDEVETGDQVWVVVPRPEGDQTLTGVVRWRGFHPSHQHVGCGIQLDQTSHELVQRIFLAVQDSK